MTPTNLGELGLNLQSIIKRLIANQNLMKLLYCTDTDPLSKSDFSDIQIQREILDKLILIVPTIPTEIQESGKSALSLRVMNGDSNENSNFTNVDLIFDIFSPLATWKIKSSNLRPFAIMGEISKSLNGKKINGLGRLNLNSFELVGLSNEISCYQMSFTIIQYE